MEYLSNEDIEFLSSQSQGKLNMVLVGMTNIMEDTQNKIQLMEAQPWYKRMANTLTGKNKMTTEEIARNHDKINVYMSEAISELYNRNCIDQNIILGLGNKLNELYASHIELKQMLGAFVNKLNQKIISIDNFHMLTTEINQGVYSTTVPIVALCKIMAQLDMRTVQDQRKMDILIRAVQDAGIVSQSEELFLDFLVNLLNISDSEAGIISFMLDNIQDNYLAEVTYDVVCEYYLLPENVRKMKNRSAVVKSVLEKKQIDLEYRVSTQEFYETLIDSISNNIIQYAIAEEKASLKEKYEKLQKYLDNCVDFIRCLYEAKISWEPIHDEFNTEQGIRTYHKFISNLYDCLNTNSPLGNNIKSNALNINAFFQNAVSLYPNVKITSFKFITGNNETVFVTENGAINITPEGWEEIKIAPIGVYVEETFLQALRKYQNTCMSLGDDISYDPFNLDTMLSWVGNYPGGFDFFYQTGEIFKTSYSGFNIFISYYSDLKEKIIQMIGDDYDKYEDLYNIVERYPVEFDEETYNNNLLYKWDHTKPYIFADLFDLDDESYTFSTPTQYGTAHFSTLMTKNHNDYWISLGVNNLKKYTLVMDVLENEWTDWSDIWNAQTYQAYNISMEDDALYVTRVFGDCFTSSLKLKIYVREMPDCYIIIK